MTTLSINLSFLDKWQFNTVLEQKQRNDINLKLNNYSQKQK